VKLTGPRPVPGAHRARDRRAGHRTGSATEGCRPVWYRPRC